MEVIGRVDYFDRPDPDVVFVYDSRWLVSPGLRLGFDSTL